MRRELGACERLVRWIHGIRLQLSRRITAVHHTGVVTTDIVRNIMIEPLCNLADGCAVVVRDTMGIPRSRPDPAWTSVFTVGDYRLKRMSRDNDTIRYALRKRLVEFPSHCPAWNQVARNSHFSVENLAPLEPVQWLEHFYGRFEDRNKVADWTRAIQGMAEFDTKRLRDPSAVPQLVAFSKEEPYMKYTKVKPRVIFDFRDKRWVLREAVFTSRYVMKWKHDVKTNIENQRCDLSPVIYTPGLTPGEVSEWLHYWTFERKFDCRVEGDCSSFDGHNCVESHNLFIDFAKRAGADTLTLRDLLAMKTVEIETPDGSLKIRMSGKVWSGQPATSLKDSIVVGHLITHILQPFVLGVDYSLMVCGDDTLILCGTQMLRRVRSAEFDLATRASRLGHDLEVKYYTKRSMYQATYCSKRTVFYLTGESSQSPMLGRLMIKFGQVPHEITDYVAWMAPQMRELVLHSACPYVRSWAQRWCDTMAITFDVGPCVPLGTECMAVPYGITVDDWENYLRLHPPRSDGVWHLPLDHVTSRIIQTDVGDLEQPTEEQNVYMVPNLNPSAGVVQWFAGKYYAYKNRRNAARRAPTHREWLERCEQPSSLYF